MVATFTSRIDAVINGTTIWSMVAIAAAVATSNSIVLGVAALLTGSGQGLDQLWGLPLIGLQVPDERRAEANAVQNIDGYVPAGLLPITTGIVIDQAGVATGATCFAIALPTAAFVGGGVNRRLSGHIE